MRLQSSSSSRALPPMLYGTRSPVAPLKEQRSKLKGKAEGGDGAGLGGAGGCMEGMHYAVIAMWSLPQDWESGNRPIHAYVRLSCAYDPVGA